MTITLCALLFFGLSNANEFPDKVDDIDFSPIIEKVVTSQPKDKHVMYVNMLFFQLKKEICFNDAALEGLERELRRTGDRKFERIYNVNSSYRHWMMDGVSEMRAYAQTIEGDIQELANDMNDAGHVLGKTITNIEVMGMSMSQDAFDGEVAWSTNFMTQKAEKADAEKTENMKRGMGEYPSPLLDYAEKGFSVELMEDAVLLLSVTTRETIRSCPH